MYSNGLWKRSILPASGFLAAGAHTHASFLTKSTTVGMNEQFGTRFQELNETRLAYQSKVDSFAAGDYSQRSNGVSLAWKYEKALIEMGDKGTTNWSAEQRTEILETGKVRGSEGHHTNNVADHPEHQANPDNIRFARDRAEHIEDFHKGNAHNKTSGDLIDRNQGLKWANQKRVFMNELKGIGTAIAISAGVGFTLGFTLSLAQNGFRKENIKEALNEGFSTSWRMGAIGLATYSGIRLAGPIVSGAIQRGLINILGVEITRNWIAVANLAAGGLISLGITGGIMYFKNRRWGYNRKDSLKYAISSLKFQTGIFAVAIVAQYAFGGYAGAAVAIGIGLALFTFTVVKTIAERQQAERVFERVIYEYQPSY